MTVTTPPPAADDVVICEPLRTPVGRYGGSFVDVPATELAATVLSELLRRTEIDPSSIDDVIFGQCYPNGEAPAIGRVAALDAGLPITVPGSQLDRRCGSGLQAVLDAAMRIQTGVADLVIAGGVESMSRAEYYTESMRWGAKGAPATLHDRLARGRVTSGGKNHPVPGGMLETAENLRREYSIPRQEQDALAAESHRRAVAAIDSGKFAEEIVPVSVPQRKGDDKIVDRDEHPRADTTLESLARLRPIMGKSDPDATVTAGNASGQNDGAAATLVTTRANAERLGLKPLARLVTWAVAGVGPEVMGIGPVPSTAKALIRAGLDLSDIDLIELNEAFAAQALAVTREWKFTDADLERTNVNGSGISLGHPVGATGVRILTTLLRELDRREARFGLETMCIGGGQGLTAIFERV
ncbi:MULTISPECIES: acetyl-CoA C-acetyltransferase [Gordonia]|jgi:acetyl-CoA C-acetyltransferase|uniref:Probable acetyl-CoA acetyltransferase n=1 Tax=Gordonia alkanivorans CGMCC 6845 TaxID=1423140 RepID=W9D9I0_9ACTN|nr:MULTISPECIES: acetyl-CoA C-acetyltransferase [Gordonia]ETA04969.1 acetyl-CoA acetyltransferase [Gordonia alkanivorans CGMCC 6845]MDH3012252.1 acetyl-CoA C-acetyltransferase [Gordonia alkanivorans]MDH3046608.1 acetyl-CoA C-acetyltransferase [Gordonia alkanivorans]MDJ0029084.1 acetyl-CoA C-acetyltransferase [Gordonia alkanivorans]QGP89732.1 acetyl-CoA C-acyltransferase [Gordonia sp. 135]